MAIYPSGEQRHGRILGGRERWKQLILLEDETQVLTAKANALLTGHPVDVFAQHFELATARIQQSSDDREQRGLARAAWPNQKGHLTQWHIQIHIPQYQRLDLTAAKFLTKSTATGTAVFSALIVLSPEYNSRFQHQHPSEAQEACQHDNHEHRKT
jgi:hypothetical protein